VGCPVALAQQQHTFCNNQIFHVLATKLADAFADLPFAKVFADESWFSTGTQQF